MAQLQSQNDDVINHRFALSIVFHTYVKSKGMTSETNQGMFFGLQVSTEVSAIFKSAALHNLLEYNFGHERCSQKEIGKDKVGV